MRTIQYAVHSDGFVVSRVGSELQWPILDYEAMQPENNFATRYQYERISVFDATHEWNLLKWTRKVPVEVKNFHRALWGFSELAS